MNTEALHAYYETLQMKSISKAAQKLHMSQPALSMQLQALERELGYTLLHRTNRGVTATEEGQIVFEYVQNVLELLDDMDNKLKKQAELKYSQILLGTCPTLAEYLIPCSLYSFKEKYPHTCIDQKTVASREVIESLKNHMIQIGLINGTSKNPEIVCHELFTSDIHLVMSAKRSYVDREWIQPEELYRLPFVLPTKSSRTRSLLQQELYPFGIDVNQLQTKLEFDYLESIKSLVVSGKGMAFLPYMAIKKELYTDMLKVIRIEGMDLKWRCSLIHLAKKQLHQTEKEFIRFLTSKERGFC